ncbi:MAG: acyltransferase family protein [Deferribacterales bacterium]
MSLKYRSDIDGLRTLAVMPVIFYHAGMTLFSGGYVGVDIFFVISGYLITSIIVRELDEDKFTIANFYVRRVKRIFPALYFLLAFTFILSFFSLMPAHFEGFGKSVVSTVLFGSNILFWRESGYFDAQAETKPLLHTWSLGVEEQFYIFFPIMLMLIARYGNKKYVRFALTLFVLSFGLSVWGTKNYPEAAFYLIPFRTWELMLGALIALGFFPKTDRILNLNLMSLAGFLMICVSIFTYKPSTPFPGYAALLPCVGTALIIMAQGGFINQILSLKPIVTIGLLSYSLYLWHWPLFALRNYWESANIPEFYKSDYFLIFLTFAFASFSYYVVEKPLRIKKIQNKKLFFRYTYAVMAVGCLVGTTAIVTNGIPQRIPEDVARLAHVPNSKFKTKECYELSADAIKAHRYCGMGVADVKPKFALWGDSHALALSDGIDKLAKETGTGGVFMSSSACPPLLGLAGTNRAKANECIETNLAVGEELAENRHIKKVILVCRWQKYTDTPQKVEEFRQALDRTLERLKGKDIYFVLDNAEANFDVPRELAKNALLKAYLPALASSAELRIPDETYEKENSPLLTLLQYYEDMDRFTVIPLFKALCDEDGCITEHNGRALYYDDDHLSVYGAQYAVLKDKEITAEMVK